MYIAIAVVLFVLDLVTFFCPLGSLLLVYVAIVKPTWFMNLVQKVYES